MLRTRYLSYVVLGNSKVAQVEQTSAPAKLSGIGSLVVSGKERLKRLEESTNKRMELLVRRIEMVVSSLRRKLRTRKEMKSGHAFHHVGRQALVQDEAETFISERLPRNRRQVITAVKPRACGI